MGKGKRSISQSSDLSDLKKSPKKRPEDVQFLFSGALWGCNAII
jgi:hypothetical protein